MKSHVSMAQHQCPICLVHFDTSEILIRKDLRQTLDLKTLTGHSPCPTCQGRINEGFIALVETAEANPGRSTVGIEVKRSGNFAFLRKAVFPEIFNVPIPTVPMVFVEPGVLEQLMFLRADDVGEDREPANPESTTPTTPINPTLES